MASNLVAYERIRIIRGAISSRLIPEAGSIRHPQIIKALAAVLMEVPVLPVL